MVVATLFDELAALPDPRDRRGCVHPLGAFLGLRDATLREDACRMRCESAAQAAALRNAAVHLLATAEAAS